jgi:hypothetical protein
MSSGYHTSRMLIEKVKGRDVGYNEAVDDTAKVKAQVVYVLACVTGTRILHRKQFEMSRANTHCPTQIGSLYTIV